MMLNGRPALNFLSISEWRCQRHSPQVQSDSAPFSPTKWEYTVSLFLRAHEGFV